MQRNWLDVARRARKGEAVVITHHGTADLVIVSAEQYEALLQDRREMER